MSSTLETIAVIVAIGTFMFYMWQERRAKKTQLSAMYLQRYWEVDDGLLRSGKGTDVHRQDVHRLLILTEDEFEAALSRHLDPTYWKKWHEWIAHPSERGKRFEDLYQIDPEATRFEHLRRCLEAVDCKDTTAHEWKQCPAKKDEIPWWGLSALQFSKPKR